MSFFDQARHRLTEAVDKHGDTISRGIDKAAAEADRRTGGKHADKIRSASAKAKDALDKLDKKDDGDLGGTPGATPGGPR